MSDARMETKSKASSHTFPSRDVRALDADSLRLLVNVANNTPESFNDELDAQAILDLHSDFFFAVVSDPDRTRVFWV